MSLLYLIILLASFQGIVIAILLLRLKHQKKTNRTLAILLLLISVAGINLYLSETGWYFQTTARAIMHALIPGVVIMPIGPLIYFYIKARTDVDYKIDKMHFLPVAIDLVPQLTAVLFFVCVGLHIRFFSVPAIGRFIDTYNVYADIPRWISLTAYVLITYQYFKTLPATVASKQRLAAERQRWLDNFLRLFLLFQTLWLPYLVLYCIPSVTDMVLEKLKWFPVYVPLASFIYYIGFKGYLLSWSEEMAERRSINNPRAEIDPAIVNIIVRSMEVDKKYLDAALDLPTLAKHTTLPVKTISLVVNKHFKMNFNDYVNSYRVAECQQRMHDPALQHLTIVGIAADCGFNSASTFQRVFKEITGSSPSEYRSSFERKT